jgi:Delta3-Delta2-enoyl-CoA isomerase
MLESIDHGRVRELRLARPPANALNAALIDALDSAVLEAQAAGFGAIILSGAPGRFSGGLDVPELLALDRPAIRATWERFFGLMRTIATSEIPVAAALTGHSPAGGTVLALFTDYRVLAEGPFVVGLNEVQVGLPVPEALLRALTYVVGARQAERLAVPGLLLGPAEALRCGLVDEIAPTQEVVPRALAWAGGLLAQPPVALRETRRRARRALRESFDGFDERSLDDLVEQWFSAEAQATLQALAARLRKKPGR